jgi:hypothetical protein
MILRTDLFVEIGIFLLLKYLLYHSDLLTAIATRPLQNAPFCPISASGSNFNPRNIQYIPVYPVKCEAYLTGAVKIIAFLDLDQNWTFFKGLATFKNQFPAKVSTTYYPYD